jgi:hypothetical protein
LIFRCSCLKAFTPSPPLTPMPCRSDDGCDNSRFKKKQGGQTRRSGAQGQGKTWPKAGVLMPGEWQEPQRWVSSTRNRLQRKDSRKADAAAVKLVTHVAAVPVPSPCARKSAVLLRY